MQGTSYHTFASVKYYRTTLYDSFISIGRNGKARNPRVPRENQLGKLMLLRRSMMWITACAGMIESVKNKADKKMVAALDAIPWKERQWGHALARNTINVKQKLGLGSGKNGKRF